MIARLPLLHMSQMVQLQAAEILASLCSLSNYKVLDHNQLVIKSGEVRMTAVSILIKTDAFPHPSVKFPSFFYSFLFNFILISFCFCNYHLYTSFHFLHVDVSSPFPLFLVRVCAQCSGSGVNSWKTFRH